MASSEPTLRGVRRVVTGHDAQGHSRVLSDAAAPNVTLRAATGGIVSTLVWVTDETPARLAGSQDQADRQMGVPPPQGGTAFRIVEFPPFKPELLTTSPEIARQDWGMQGHALPGADPRHPFIHRTRTVDYIVVLEGEIDMLLDEGEVHLRAGDTLIQRGTNHAWVNRGSAPCRVAIIFVDAIEPSEIVSARSER